MNQNQYHEASAPSLPQQISDPDTCDIEPSPPQSIGDADNEYTFEMPPHFESNSSKASYFRYCAEDSYQPLVSLAELERELAEKRIFTRQLLEQAASDVDKSRIDRDVEIIVKCIQGNRHLRVWPPWPPLHNASGVYEKIDRPRGKYGAVLEWPRRRYMAEEGSSTLAPYRITPNNAKKHISTTQTFTPGDNELKLEVRGLDDPPHLQYLKDLEQQWELSPHWACMKPKVIRLAQKVHIKNIVCIDLGDMWNGQLYEPDEEGRELFVNGLCAYVCHMHMFACFLSRFLRRLYQQTDPDSPAIEICAYCPNYTKQDLILMEKLSPPIKMVSDPYHFLATDQHSLVINPGEDHSFEVIADLLYPSGPAAFLCHEIWVDMPWYNEQLVNDQDLWTPRVGRMLSLYEKEDMKDLGLRELDDGSEGHHTSHPSIWLDHQVLYTRDNSKFVEVEELEDAIPINP